MIKIHSESENNTYFRNGGLKKSLLKYLYNCSFYPINVFTNNIIDGAVKELRTQAKHDMTNVVVAQQICSYRTKQ